MFIFSILKIANLSIKIYIEIERQQKEQKEQEELDRIAAEQAEKDRQAEGKLYHFDRLIKFTKLTFGTFK